MFSSPTVLPFDQLTRIGEDDCCISQSTLQSSQYNSYMLQNYYASDCSMARQIDMATSQPCIQYSGSYSLAPGGCNVDTNSKLLLGATQTNPKGRIDLFGRPFATVPYLGRGSVDPTLEANIQQGESISNKKSIALLAERMYGPVYMQQPDQVERFTQMGQVMGSSVDVRRGVDTKDAGRDAHFYKK